MTRQNPTLLWLFILFTFNSQAQDEVFTVDIAPAGGKYHVVSFNADNGLSGGVCETIIQDSKGRIWAGTRNGLNCIEGTTVKNYFEADGLPSDHILSIAEGNNNVIWIGTKEGLASYDGRKFSTYEYADTNYSSNNIWSVGKHSSGVMMAGTPYGIFKVQGNHLVSYLSFDTTASTKNLVRYLHYDSEGYLWAGCWSNIYRIDTDDKVVDTLKSGISLGWAEDSKGNVWYTAWGPNLQKYNLKTGQITEYKLGTAIPGIAIDHEDNVWLGTWEQGMVQLITDTSGIKYGVNEGIATSSIWGMTGDHEGNIWCGTFGGGLSVLADNKFASFSKNEGIAANLTNQIVEDHSGNIWVASEGGLSRIGPDWEIRTFDEKDGLSSTKCHDLFVSKDGTVWVVLYEGGDGVYTWDGDKLTPIRGGGFELFEDRDGNFWQGLDGGGARRYTKENQKKHDRGFQEKINNGRRTRVMDIEQDSKGNVWLGAEYHAWHVVDTNDQFFTELFPEYLRYNHGGIFVEDDRGYYWLGIGGKGLYRCKYDAGALEIIDSLTDEHGVGTGGFADAYIEDSIMWLNAETGLIKFNLDHYYTTGEFSYTTYGIKDGYLGQASGNIFRSTAGDLVISTTKGILLFKENNIRTIPNPPITLITSVLLDKKEVDWRDFTKDFKSSSTVPQRVYLEHNQNHLTFNFIGISYNHPELVRYQYMLEGFDERWSPATDITQAVYSNIPPGEYTFKVKAMNKEGMWDETPETIVIVIGTPFWQTTAFRIIVFLLIAGLFYLFYRIRTRKLQLDKKRLEERVSQRTQQLQVAYHQIEEKNLEITDSISYAKRIQSAILPPPSSLQRVLGESFILYLPKDIVAGDFYWLNQKGDYILFAVADCTGHGVPGAMVSVVCHNALNRAVREFSLTDPGKILDKVREIVIETFEASEEEVKDGMDIGLCSWHIPTKTLTFAGAHNGLYKVSGDELSEIKANKQPVGKFDFAEDFTTQAVDVKTGDMIYLFSDGFADQFGGEKGKKLKYKNFKEIVIGMSGNSMDQQLDQLNKEFNSWKGSYEQIDDVCMLGFRIP